MLAPSSLSLVDKFIALIESRPTSDRFILRLLLVLVVISGLLSAINLSQSFSSTVPTKGGVVVEGIVGIPRFVNPALALTRADQDVTSLIYSGLLKIGPEGALVPNLAESVTLTNDGRSYEVILNRNHSFHDGSPLTTRDVIFTINLLRDPDLKSPLRGNWVDVTIEEVDEYKFIITLPEPYSPFIENLTFGVMPHHIWSKLPIEQLPFSQYNTQPIGSGPFQIEEVLRDESGLISGYTLKPFTDGPNRPNLGAFELRFYQNEELLAAALARAEINATAFLPTKEIANLGPDYVVWSEPLPRLFGVFFNQNRSSVLRDQAARQALSVAVNRDRLVEEALNGFGVPTNLPILTTTGDVKSEDTTPKQSFSGLTEAETILRAGGWRKNNNGVWQKRIDQIDEVLGVTIKTGNAPLFEKTANLIAEDWRALGVEVQIEQYEQTGLVQSVIRTRDFQALLFGLDMNRSQDLFPFWYSSQKDDPGLNIAQYTNIKVDRLLERARVTEDVRERYLTLNEIASTIASETPAVFLFAPSLPYVVHKDISLHLDGPLGKPADRFMSVESWFAKSETVWPIFNNQRQPSAQTNLSE